MGSEAPKARRGVRKVCFVVRSLFSLFCFGRVVATRDAGIDCGDSAYNITLLFILLAPSPRIE